MIGKTLKMAALVAGLLAAPVLAAETDTWDGLVRVEAKNFDAVYLLPGANFAEYTKVMLDPPEASFRKNWQRDYNSTTAGSNRISDDEAREMLQAVQDGLAEVFTQAYTEAGIQVVTAPGPDVLRLRTGIVNLDVAAPDQMTAGRSRTYSQDAGEATIVIEARDSMSGAVIARALDRREIGDTGFITRRTSVSNRSDLSRVFKSWAKKSIEGYNRLRTMAPIAANPAPQ